MPKASTPELDIVKKPHSKVNWSEQRMLELAECSQDPLYFMRHFMKVQHPIKGALPFEPYEYQVRMINAMHEHKNSIMLTARQMGKCVTNNTIINKNGKQVKIGSLLRLSWREKLISLLEKWLISLAKH